MARQTPASPCAWPHPPSPPLPVSSEVPAPSFVNVHSQKRLWTPQQQQVRFPVSVWAHCVWVGASTQRECRPSAPQCRRRCLPSAASPPWEQGRSVFLGSLKFEWGHMTNSGQRVMGRSNVCRIYSRAPIVSNPPERSPWCRSSSMSVWLHPSLDPIRSTPSSGTDGRRHAAG